MGAIIDQRRARTSRQARAILALTVIWIVLLAVVLMARGRPHDSQEGADAPGIGSNQQTDRGERVIISGTVHRVLGPRSFTVTSNVVDDGETLIVVPAPNLALVRTGMSVAIDGTSQVPGTTGLVHTWGWNDDRSADRLAASDVVVADTVFSDGRTVNTKSFTWAGAIADLRLLTASVDSELVGRAVDLRRAPISAVRSRSGFWIATNADQIFVLTADETHFRRGQQVNLRGVVLALPDGMKNSLDDYGAARDETIYVYATQVRVVP